MSTGKHIAGKMLIGGGLLAMALAPGPVALQAAEDAASRFAAGVEQAREISFRRSWQEAQELLDQLAGELGQAEPRARAEFHLLEARHLALADRSDEALDRAAGLLDGPLDHDQRMRALQFVANVAVLMRAYEKAFDHLMQALRLTDQVDDPVASMSTYNMAAYMFGRVGEHQRAIEYGELAVAIGRDSGDPNNECISLQRLAPVFKWAGDLERAESSYRRAIEICSEAGNRLFVGVLSHGLADTLRLQGRLPAARELAEASIDALSDSGFPLGEHEARLVLAEILSDAGGSASELYEQIERVARYFQDRELFDQVARVELLMARVAAERGDAEAAMAAFERQLVARERFLDRDRAMLMGYLQVEFDLDLKARQIAILEENARLARLEADAAAQQQRQRTIILLLSAMIVILLSLMLWRVFRARQHFEHLSRHDRLSGLPNHAWFFERAEAMLELARISEETTWLIVADIDHFKTINDRHGHLVGDQVLAQIARRLADAFGQRSLVGRIGGEEFGVLMHGTPEAVVSGIQHFQAGASASIRRDDPAVTLSFGIARYRVGESLTQLRQRADQAMYLAKQTGRNRHVFEDEINEEPGQDDGPEDRA